MISQISSAKSRTHTHTRLHRFGLLNNIQPHLKGYYEQQKAYYDHKLRSLSLFQIVIIIWDFETNILCRDFISEMCPAQACCSCGIVAAAAAITGHLEAASRSDKCDSESERLIIVAEKKWRRLSHLNYFFQLEGERGLKSTVWHDELIIIWCKDAGKGREKKRPTQTISLFSRWNKVTFLYSEKERGHTGSKVKWEKRWTHNCKLNTDTGQSLILPGRWLNWNCVTTRQWQAGKNEWTSVGFPTSVQRKGKKKAVQKTNSKFNSVWPPHDTRQSSGDPSSPQFNIFPAQAHSNSRSRKRNEIKQEKQEEERIRQFQRTKTIEKRIKREKKCLQVGVIAQTTLDLKLQTVCVCARHSAISERKKLQSFTVGDFPTKKCRAIFKASKAQSEKTWLKSKLTSQQQQH